MRVLLLGVAYFPFRTAGEKNFFLELVPHLAPRLDDLAVASLNDVHEPLSHQVLDGERRMPIYNFCRPLHTRQSLARRAGTRAGQRYYHHRHRLPQEMAEKTMALLVHRRRLREVMERHEVDVIHFLDNFGPGIPLARRLFPGRRITFAAASYVPRGPWFDRLLAPTLRSVDGVLAYTHAYRRVLLDLGVQSERVVVCPWGVDPGTNTPLPAAARAEVRRAHGIGEGQLLLLWTGFIQQIQEPDFRLAVRAAREIVRGDERVRFLFAFKPESWKPAYAREAGERLTVTGELADFRRVLASSDLLFSPVGDCNSTVAPPLTWLEAMSAGVPVLSTRAGGVDEVIEDDRTGFIAADHGDIAPRALRALARRDLPQVGGAARGVVNGCFNLEEASRRYAAAWRALSLIPARSAGARPR